MRIEVTGTTLQDAINNAMIELGTVSDNIQYDVLQEGTQGFLGIGAKPFKISAFRKDDKEEIYKIESANKEEKLVQNETGVYEFKSNKTNEYKKTEEKHEKYENKESFVIKNPDEVYRLAKNFLDPIIAEFKTKIEMSYTVSKESNTLIINIKGDKIGVLIGKHGQTLDALQHLVNIIVNNDLKEHVKIRIDSENYRDKRNKTLEALAKSIAVTVRKTKKEYVLEPMSSYERRIIHSVLQKERNIDTVSVGVDRERHVVVKYRRN